MPKKSISVLLSVVFLIGGSLPAQAVIPNDLEYAKQQSMWESVNAPAAWDIAQGSKQAVVAIIDTGVDSWHPDLAENIWTNQFEIEGNGADDDHNGYVDDIHGWNFIEKNNDVRTSVFNKLDEPEAVRHGTVAAGLIGAVGNNGRDGTGVNWRVSIMPLRAVASDGYGSMSKVAEAVLYAVNNGADVISMSMVSSFQNATLRAALRAAYEQGVVVVTAAGNDSINLDARPQYPICYDNSSKENWILGVGALASSSLDKLSDFSNYGGSCIDLLAPGSDIYSTERYAPEYGYAKEFGGPWDGTSFAVPIVAGTVALIKSIHPEWMPDKIVDILKTTADNLNSANPSLVGELGAGRINIGRAVERAARETTFAGVDLGRMFFVDDNNKLGRFDLAANKNYLLTKIDDAEIIDLARLGNRPGGREFVAALLRRDRFYYVKFFDETGRRLKEMALAGVSDKTAVANKIVWRGENLVVGFINKKTKFPYLIEYDLDGNRLRELKIKNLVDWESEARTGYLITVTGDKKASFKWQLYNNKNEIVDSDIWRGFKSIDDLRLGYFWGQQDNLQISAVIKTAKKTEWKIIDVKSKIGTTEILAQKSAAYTTIPGLYSSRPGFFVYSAGDSDYRIYNGRGELILGGEF